MCHVYSQPEKEDMQGNIEITLGNKLCNQTLGGMLNYQEDGANCNAVPTKGCDWLAMPNVFYRSI